MELLNLIQLMHLSSFCDDQLAWGLKNSGMFDIKSASKVVDPPKFYFKNIHINCHTVWKLRIPYKYKMLVCHLLHEILPVGSVLARTMKHLNPNCSRCGLIVEDHLHLFRDFYASRVISVMTLDSNKNIHPPNLSLFFNSKWAEWMELNVKQDTDWVMLFGVTIWHL